MNLTSANSKTLMKTRSAYYGSNINELVEFELLGSSTVLLK